MPRYRPPGIVPLELWDLCVGDAILWGLMDQPDFPAIFVRALEELHAGRAISRSDGPVSDAARGFDAVFIGGGGAGNPRLRTALAEAPWPVLFGVDEVYVGSRGGHALLAQHGLAGIVADLGQTRLKVSWGEKRWDFARDFARLPLREDGASPAPAGQRAALRAFLCGHLAHCGTAAPEGIVLALPARLDDTGSPEGSSYVGMAGDAQLVPDVLRRLGWEDAPNWLVNDAELAAMTARLDERVRPEDRTLVLTLGFGLGAALLLPCA